MNYRLFFNSNGQFESANTEDGRSVPYYPLNPAYSKLDDPLTIAFLAAVEAGEVDISDRPPTPQPVEPDWAGFVNLFTFPGNPLYLSIATKVGDSPWLVKDHWDNFKSMVLDLQNTDALAAGVAHLALLLQQANQPLSAEETADWNSLMEQFNFPEGCRL